MLNEIQVTTNGQTMKQFDCIHDSYLSDMVQFLVFDGMLKTNLINPNALTRQGCLDDRNFLVH